MKELFTEVFWHRVKKTFQDALEDPASKNNAPDAIANDAKAAMHSDTAPSSAGSGEPSLEPDELR